MGAELALCLSAPTRITSRRNGFLLYRGVYPQNNLCQTDIPIINSLIIRTSAAIE